MLNTGDNIKKINITPEFAKSLLENNTHNRRLREGAVEKYARDMLLDNWNTDVVDPICISVNGNLINGQHRLYAIIKANKTIPMWVQYGVPENHYLYIDDGIHRPLADRLEQRNVKSAHNIAALGRSAYAIEIKHQNISSANYGRIGQTLNTRKAIYESDAVLVRYIDTHFDKLNDCLRNGTKLRRGVGSEPLKGYALAYWILDRANNSDKLARFVDDWEGEVSRDYNIQLVKNSILKRKAIQKRLNSLEVVEMVLYAFENFESDKVIKSVRNIEKMITLYDAKLARVYEAEQC